MALSLRIKIYAIVALAYLCGFLLGLAFGLKQFNCVEGAPRITVHTDPIPMAQPTMTIIVTASRDGKRERMQYWKSHQPA